MRDPCGYKIEGEEKTMKKIYSVWVGSTRKTEEFDTLDQVKARFQKPCLKCNSMLTVTDEVIQCEKCKLKVQINTYNKRTREDLRLSAQGCGLYALTDRISKEEWCKVSKYFSYYHGDSGEDEDEDIMIEMYDIRGWCTRSVTEVEKILNITGERTVEAQEEKSKIVKEEARKIRERKDALLYQIDTRFKDAEYPQSEKGIRVDGDRIENPDYKMDIYGGGQWWMIQKEYIWKIQNNGHDGDDWGRNNVATGGAGAIGHRVPYDENLESLLRKLEADRKNEKVESGKT